MNLAENLDDFLDLPFDEQEPKPQFVIDNADRADWAIRKILKSQSKIDEAKYVAKQRIEQVKQWEAGIIEEQERSIEFFQAKLKPYAEAQLAGGKSKTLKLPSGNISFKSVDAEFFSGGEKIKAENEKLIEYVKSAAPDYLKVEETVRWGELKKTLTVTANGQVITEDGEILEFITAQELPDSISVKERK